MFLSCLITIAPASSATWAVLSDEPSSQTNTSDAYAFALDTISPIALLSLKAGTQTITFFRIDISLISLLNVRTPLKEFNFSLSYSLRFGMSINYLCYVIT